jgi:undecaprenyl-diphosphatase
VGLAAAGAFAVLTALVLAAGLLPFDVPGADAVRAIGIPAGTWAGITALGDGTVLFPVGTALGVYALVTRRYRLTLVVAVILVGASLFTEAMKGAVARPRPPWEHLVAAGGFSFPSGHSLNSSAVYGLLALVAWRAGRLPAPVRRLAAVAGLGLPLAVGLSRIALGVHYPSDALGGWLGGAALVALGAVVIDQLAAMEPRGAAPAEG